MKEIKKDLFDCIFDPGVDAICITTNPHYMKDGRAAMGGGCARACADKWPQTAVRLGKCLRNFGTNIPFVIGAVDKEGNYIEPSLKIIKERRFKCLIFSFPTINNLMDGADLELIKRSAKELAVLVDRFELRNIVCPRMGSGIGGLPWTDVKAAVQDLLDDKYTIVSYENET